MKLRIQSIHSRKFRSEKTNEWGVCFCPLSRLESSRVISKMMTKTVKRVNRWSKDSYAFRCVSKLSHFLNGITLECRKRFGKKGEYYLFEWCQRMVAVGSAYTLNLCTIWTHLLFSRYFSKVFLWRPLWSTCSSAAGLTCCFPNYKIAEKRSMVLFCR